MAQYRPKGGIKSVSEAINAGDLSNNANLLYTILTADNVLTGHIQTVAAATDAGDLSNDANVKVLT